jgi:nitroreductase
MMMIETMKKRYSVRTYEEKPVEIEKIEKLTGFIKLNNKGALGNPVRLKVIDVTNAEKDELKQLGTYGVIKGPHIFIAGAVKTGENCMEDFGYCMEKAILEATRLGLGTVWLGGFLNRSTFAKKIGISEDEVIPAVTPVGYPADKRTFVDRIIRTMSGGKNRMEFEELFFAGEALKPLEKSDIDKYYDVLEAVRWAPSASNKQPWRIMKDKDKNIFHFYLYEDKKYNNRFKGIQLQNIDMGIAMCHFELVCLELGLKGKWEKNMFKSALNDLKYIVSWIAS